MSLTAFASRTSYLKKGKRTYTPSAEPEERHKKGINIFLFAISSSVDLLMYLPVSILYIFTVTIITLILNAISSRRILTLDTTYVSALQACLQATALLDRACSFVRTGE